MVSKVLLSHLKEKADKHTLIHNFFSKFSITKFYLRSTIFLVEI